MTRLVHTPIEPASDDDRQRTVLVSDLHVSRDDVEVTRALGEVLGFAAEVPDRSRVLILGDLFEFFVNARQLAIGAWRTLTERVRETVEAGVPVTVLHGNRDFLLGRGFARRTGARVVAGGLTCRLGRRRAILLHGDELCLNDVPYQRSKRWLRHPVTRLIARNLPLSLALRAGSTARSKSVTQAATQPPAERFDPVEAAAAEVLEGADLLVFGHIHRPASGELGGKEYRVLPAFDETSVFLFADGDVLQFRRADGGVVPDYPEARFAPREA